MHNRSKTSKTSSGAGSDTEEKRRKASENKNQNLIQYTYKREENTFIRYKY